MKAYDERIVAALADTVQDLRERCANLERMLSELFKNVAEQRDFEALVTRNAELESRLAMIDATAPSGR